DDRTDRHSVRVLPIRINGRALRSRSGKTRVGMRSLCARLFPDFRRPLVALPIETVRWWFIGHAFPPNAAFRRQSNVRKNRVGCQRGHCIWVGLYRCAWRNSKETGLRIDRVQPSVCIRFDPGNVVTHGPNFPAVKSFGWNEHREIGFAAGTGKSSGNISLLALWVLDSDDQHVLSHPTFVTGDVRSYSQRETLLAEQSIAAIARSVGPNLARLGKMDDVFLLVTRPRHVFFTVSEWRADRVHAWHDTLVILVDLCVNRKTDARHDAHVHHDVR